jgi:hypothetical protein
MASDDRRQTPYKPGAISLFFVVKAGIFAAAFWIWLLVLVLGDGTVTGWHLFAASGAITTTLVGVVLGIRMALQANAAERYAETKRMLVEISWNTAFNASTSGETSTNVVPFPSAVTDSGGWAQRQPGHDSGGWPRPDGGERRR